MQNLRNITAADWGLALQRAARIAAPVLALLVVIAADLVVITYRAGKATGEAIAHRADQLAALFADLLAPRPAAAPVPPAPQREAQARPTAPHLRALREECDRLEGMTQRQLMALAGTRRKLAKRQLVALLAAA